MKTGVSRFLTGFLSMALLASVALPAAALPTIDTTAKEAIVADVETDTVLLSKAGFEQMHPASMTKMMTAYIVMDQLHQGKLKLDQTLPVSESAWRMQGSKTFVHVGDQVSVADLLRGVIIQSGNDACQVLAEGIAGTEEAFAQLMNAKAKELGMDHSHFKNSSGWPDPEHLMSPHDLYLIALHTMKDFPEYYEIYGETEFTYSGIRQPNRNLLLGKHGVDGLKTGHTEESGYGITVSGKDESTGRRLIVVVNGLSSEKERAQEAEKLLLWGYRNFENKTIVKNGQEVLPARVWFGEKPSVSLVATKDVKVTLPKGGANVKISAKYSDPLPSPVVKGTEVGTLILEVEGQEPQNIPLVTSEDVAALSGTARIVPAFKHYLFGSALESAAPVADLAPAAPAAVEAPAAEPVPAPAATEAAPAPAPATAE